MSVEMAQLETLRHLSTTATVMSEAGIKYVYLPGLKVTVAGVVRELDALLCPMQHGGYTTRLFLSAPIPERGKNWTAFTILGRTWHACSWNNVPASLPLLQILRAHLEAMR
jgi:hypothetical protein